MSYPTPTSPRRSRPYNDENSSSPLMIRTPNNPFRSPLTDLSSQTSPNFSTPGVSHFSQPLLYTFVSTPAIATPKPRKKRRVAQNVSPNTRRRLTEDWQERNSASVEMQKEEEDRDNRAKKTRMLDEAFKSIRKAGFPTFRHFLEDALTAHDPSQASQISQLVKNHGPALFSLGRKLQPAIVDDWIISSHRELVSMQCKALAELFQPPQLSRVTDTLSHFSIKQYLADAERVAPLICDILRQIGYPNGARESKYKNRELIIATALCMLAKSRNEHATEFQTTMGMYFLASGTQSSLFAVLNHAGISLSYTQVILKLKQLSQERLKLAQTIARLQAFMLIWDNLNFRFIVAEQRHDAKSHFDSGTTATMVPLYGFKHGELSCSLKPPRLRHVLELDIKAEDLLPSAEEALRVQQAQIWHISDILYDAFPDLRKRIAKTIPPFPSVLQIPLHKTEQYPLPAMHIDESSLDGTLQVFNSILKDSLKLTEEELKAHGLIICAGDQLSLSLLDKVSAIRRDDTDFMDNIGKYTLGQDGLLHVKFSHTRMVANEYWGKPNSKSPWSLWRINTLLGRKPVCAGWTAKSPAPFRPIWELILNLTLPAHILDAFRIFCSEETVEAWVKKVDHHDTIALVAQKIHDELCSGHRVAQLRQERAIKRDVPLENIILFNRDALHLRQLKYAIKQGDVGAVLDLITHLMLAFRGTGHTPKYADALFHIVINLKRMDPLLRRAWLFNWLANLTGKPNGFKEMDLLQEHLNFWLKVIYSAKGVNRTWAWLSMVSVCIFALRDVIRNVREEFSIPFNSIRHAMPSTSTDVNTIRTYLQAHRLQEFCPARENNAAAVEARDLMVIGAHYANKPNCVSADEAEDEEAQCSGNIDVGEDLETGLEDLLLDEEEYPEGLDAENVFAAVNEIINEMRSLD
ncbi:hypothetical protein JR316_0001646 [Psilocybe cubensis]|uniref:DUF6589 domain-containing protein n=2 Tax=Psilocybe cubensis TaxID=181762 RepID=A0A8H7Y3J8_PSICU|nr:hypothetical protein JR316_0001646 [Psilocybe cubensis]KAH9484746.1 hypothetical protein JR316_0001646 [Psilocybe cubensis]